MKYLDHPFLKPGKMEARLYQELLATRAIEQGNTLIVAPTALGKTPIALMVSLHYLAQEPKKKILFLAPTKPLVAQHLKSFEDFTNILELDMMTGETPAKKRRQKWDDARVLFATPQTIESCLFAGDVSLDDISLIVFDEAHRAVGDYAYVFIADQYKRKTKGHMLALTASPGSSREKIQEVCGNLFIKNVEVRTEKDDDVKPYVHEKDFEWIYVDLPEEYAEIKELIEGEMKASLTVLKSLGMAKNTSIKWYNRRNLLKMQQYLMKIKGKNPQAWKAISHVAALMKLHHAHELVEAQGIDQVREYFEKLWKEETKASKRMRESAKMQKAKVLVEKAVAEEIHHPKIEKLLELLGGKEHLANPKGLPGQAIVFTHYRTSSKRVAKFLNDNGITARRFVGQTTREGEKGLRQKEQIEMINEFRNGCFQVLVATSVGEEGLDIPSVDLVVFYEPVASEIRKIQRAGRTGRHGTGRVVVLITKGTVDEAYYWASKRKEKNMKEALEEISSTPIAEKQQTLKEFSTPGKVTIFVDNRERASGITRELMRNDGIAIKPMQLPVGDFLVSERVVVERKSANDFVQSMIDGRLFGQAQALKDNFRNPIILIEGEDLYSVRNVHPNAIRGALAAIAIDFQIPIIWSTGVEDSAAIITVLAKREQEDQKRNVRLRGDKRAMTDRDQQEFLVGGLPGVGGLLAKDLLSHFGTVEKVFKADERKLKKVGKIGPKKAKEIRRVLTKKYSE
ncbi:MAG: DEAD/DEAH box helicase [Candidatus Diapherotrites archaeon]|nr:DEAD/DEAH box helicase [Candidatus Diapherotrites archaeon]